MRRRLKHLIIGCAIALWIISVGLHLPVRATDDYYAAAQEASTLTTVPVRVPAYIPTDRMFQTSAHATRDGGYLLLMRVPEPCDTDCGIGEIRGEPISNLNWTIQSRYPTAQPITLITGQPAFYVPPELDAEYSLTRIVWDEGDTRYEVAIYFASADDILTMANSAVSDTY
ncbi:MAG: hypothetical protein AAF766_22235 [Cyanobacteria bacterium P01_D01_bin.14]